MRIFVTAWMVVRALAERDECVVDGQKRCIAGAGPHTGSRARSGEQAAARVIARPDPATQRIVATRPGEILTPRAQALGFSASIDFSEIVHEHMEYLDNPGP